MQTTTGIDPRYITMADLEVMEAPTTAIVKAEPVVKPMTKRDTRQRIIGAMKMINWLCGGEMQSEVDSTDFLVRRIDALEEEAAEREKTIQALRQQLEDEKNHYRNQVSQYTKALRNISVVLDGHSDPFELKAPSKWTKPQMGQWMINAVESMKWAIQRVDNLLDPINAVKIADDPEP
jgi:hypothetical protein